MSTARNEMIASLEPLEELEGFRVVGYSRSLTIAEPTVMVRVDIVTPAGACRDYAMSLIVAVPQTDPTGPADDALDDALEDVLYALDVNADAVGIQFKQAIRSVLDEAYPAYRVEVNVRTQREEPTP
jgi:hypothetical protein